MVNDGPDPAPSGDAYPAGPYPPGQASTGQIPPAQPAPGQPAPGHVPPGQLSSGPIPAGQLPPGQPAPGQLAPGQLPPGQPAPGQLAPGQLARGPIPHGPYPAGPYPSGSYPPGPYPPGPPQPDPYAPGAYPPGPLPPGQARSGGFPPGPSQSFVPGPPPTGPYRVGPPASGPQRSRLPVGAVLAIALVTALIAGGIGGLVGSRLADRGSLGGLGGPVPSAGGSAPAGPIEAVASRVLPSVVQLRVDGGGQSGEGSGMVLSADGLLLTNNHVVAAAADGGTVVAVFQDGRNAPAKIVGRDPNSDIAVLRVTGVSGLTPIMLGNSDSVRVGQQVVAFGSPLGLGGTVTTGIISAIDRAVSVGGDIAGRTSGAATVLDALQTDAAINPGNSGGPLVDTDGRVIGVNSAIATTGAEGGSIGVGFSIPINEARRTAKELEATGHATRTVLGAGVTAGGRELNGAVLGPIAPDGPAAKAGIRQGQTVTRVDSRIIAGGDELIAAIRGHAPGDRVSLLVDGRKITVILAGTTG